MNKRYAALGGKPQTQRGAVLAVALALLTTLTLVALAAGQSIRSHARTLATLSERQQLFELAESALREGEAQVAHLRKDAAIDEMSSARVNWAGSVAAQASWWRQHASSAAAHPGQEGLGYYIVEPYAQTLQGHYFRVTAGSVLDGKPVVVLQSIYLEPEGDDPRAAACNSGTPCERASGGRQSWLQLR